MSKDLAFCTIRTKINKDKYNIDTNKTNEKDIAIIGMSGKFAECSDINTFWDKIKSGSDCVRPIIEQRRKDSDLLLKLMGKSAEKAEYFDCGYMDDIDKFDNSFFGISPKEASLMDPNQRLFLEAAWSAIEDAGYLKSIVGSKTSIYVGFSVDQLNNYKNFINSIEPENMSIAYAGNVTSVIASRLSYLLDLKGAGIVVDTSCSSSLVAVHLACQELRRSECDMAIVGGVKVRMLPLVDQQVVGVESSDARCKTFDDSANGIGGGEGVAAVLLKPLAKAIADSDNIHAVIKGSAMNQDGRSIGITSPNPDAQCDVITEAWEDAQIEPDTISYIEAHGTGTKLGDPIELDGIKKAFAKYTDKKQFCAISSVKTNIGHLDNAAGMAGLIKAVMALKHRELPPSIHLNRPNRNIKFQDSPVYVNNRLLKWEVSDTPYRCGVSAFGLSGINCHIILEEAPELIEDDISENDNLKILAISAKSEASLKRLLVEYKKLLKNKSKLVLNNICFTANTGRMHYNHRIIFAFTDANNLESKIDKVSSDFLSNKDEGIFCGDYKIVSSNKEQKNIGELTEGERRLLSELTDKKIEKLVSLDREDRALLYEICNLYVQGAEVNWERLYVNRRCRRISLPTYPFERTRCWMDIETDSYQELLQTNKHYSVYWKHKELIGNKNTDCNGVTIVFKNTNTLSNKLLEMFKQHEKPVIEVSIGNKYNKVNDTKYEIENRENDYKRVIEEVKREGISQIIHLLTLTDNEPIYSAEMLEEILNKSTHSLRYIVKGLHQNSLKGVNIALISQYVETVDNSEKVIRCENAALFGLGKVINVENYDIKCKFIDIDDSTDVTNIKRELSFENCESNIAYRNNKRFVKALDVLDIQKLDNVNTEVRDEGVYIITGGIGNVGLEAAKFIASGHEVKIALINRSKMPERGQWSSILHQGTDIILCDKIRLINDIESNGSVVEFFSADVSKEEEIIPLIDSFRCKFSKINGVIHCAGIGVGIKGCRVEDDSDEIFNKVLAPKVQGTWLLDKATENDKLDFFIAFSSPITLTGALGSGSYTSANAYLDSFVMYRNRLGKRTINIGINKFKVKSNIIDDDKRLFRPINEDDIANAFMLVFSKNIQSVIVGLLNYDNEILYLEGYLPFIIDNNLKQNMKLHREKQVVQLKTTVTNAKSTHYRLKGNNEQGYTETENLLGSVFCSVLGLDEIDIYDNFYELGGDSIIAAKIVNIINKEKQLDIKITDLLRNPSIKLFAKTLDINYFKWKALDSKCPVELVPIEKKEYYPTSAAQKRVYIVNQLEGSGTSYNEPKGMLIEGTLNKEGLEFAFAELVRRHEALRTSFEIIGGEPVQIVHRYVNFKVNYIEAKEQDIKETVEAFILPFDLSVAPLLRVTLVNLGNNKYLLLYDMHHIITDGISIGILIKEFNLLYRGEVLQDLKIQYKDFTEWQNKVSKTDLFKKEEQYWLNVYSKDIPTLNLPTDFQRPVTKSFAGGKINGEIDRKLTAKIKRLMLATDSTLYMILMCVYNILLYKYTDQEDIIVGLPVAGRYVQELDNVIGIFVNTMSLRNYPAGNKTFIDFLSEVKENTYEMYENQNYHFNELVTKLNIHPDRSRNPLFDTMLILHNVGAQVINIDNIKVSPFLIENKVAKFDITLEAFENDGKIALSLEYCSALFKRSTANNMLEQFVKIMGQITCNPNILLSQIKIINESEEQQLLKEFNKTSYSYPERNTCSQLFEKQVEKNPDKVAVVMAGKSLSYYELNERSNQLARMLKKHGVKKGDIVGIFLPRSIDVIISVLGILKANATCLHIDVKYPMERVNFILEDSNAKTILKYKEAIIDNSFEDMLIDIDCCNLNQFEKDNIDEFQESDQPAYVIYTSGTTGKPKGVMLHNYGIINHAFTKISELEIKKSDIIGHTLSFSFVASIWQIFSPFFMGSTLVLYPENVITNSFELFTKAEQDKVTILEVVPSLLNSYLELIEDSGEKVPLLSLKVLVLTGEKVTPTLVNKFYNHYNKTLINAYGQSECSDDTLHYRIPFSTDTTNVPIGKASHNTQIYILNKDLQPQPIGIPGELYISGDGLAKGYLNREELTKERFVENPFKRDSLMFKTGDIVKWLPDGNIDYLGRSDNQIKVRGFRIELEEIEFALSRYQKIKEAVVIDRKDKNGNQYICAFYTSIENIPIAEIRQFLADILPDYMLPAYFIKLDNIPINVNGKVDRLRLPQLTDDIVDEFEYVPPQGEIEEVIALVWRDLLMIEKIGRDQNFFYIGGNSLKAVTLIYRLQKEFKITIPLLEIFKFPTISGLANYLRGESKTEYFSIKPTEKMDYYPVSSAQRRIFFASQIYPDSIAYNVYGALKIEGRIDLGKIEIVINILIERHDILRTSFKLLNGELVQVVHNKIDFNILYVNLPKEPLNNIIENFIHPFDLSKAPLLRVGLIGVSENEWIFIYDIHHIISDRLSIKILLEEFAALYADIKLPDVKLQYNDFADWQNKMLNSDVIKEQKSFWMDLFNGDIPCLNMPTDYNRPNTNSFKGDVINFELSKELSDKLNSFILKTNTTHNIVIIAIYSVLLSKYTGQEDIIVGTSTSGRQHTDLENVIGMFVNTLAIRTFPTGQKTFIEYLGEVRDTLIKAYQNQDYQFDDLIKELNITTDNTRNPLFSTMLITQNIQFPDLKVNNLTITPLEIEKNDSRFDFQLDIFIESGAIRFKLYFCTDLFMRKTMEIFRDRLLLVIEEILENSNKKIVDIESQSESKMNMLLDFSKEL